MDCQQVMRVVLQHDIAELERVILSKYALCT